MENLDKNLPKLRFKEFSEEWKNKEFDKVFSFMTTNSLSRDKLNYECGTVKNIHYGDIHTQFPILLDAEKEIIPFVNNSVSLEKFKTENYCKVGDILFADASEDMNDIGKNIEIVNIGKHKILSGLHVLHARPKKDDFVTGFCGYLFRANIMRSKIKNEAQGAKVLGISKGRVSTIDVVYPTNKKEQQKIADCLSSLDERINLQEKKLENLKKHKQGLMQQLFPDLRGGVASSLRFMGFTEDWRVVILGDIFHERNEKPLNKTPIFSLTIEDGIVAKSERYERAFLIKGNLDDAYKNVKNNDLVSNPMNLRFGAIAKYDGLSDVSVSKYYNVFYCDKSVNSDFCIRMLKTEAMLIHYNNFSTGSLVEKRRVHFKDFVKFKIKLPTLAEQQKIADCLSSLDELITANNDKIIALKQHKKGMMQGLFPKVA